MALLGTVICLCYYPYIILGLFDFRLVLRRRAALFLASAGRPVFAWHAIVLDQFQLVFGLVLHMIHGHGTYLSPVGRSRIGPQQKEVPPLYEQQWMTHLPLFSIRFEFFTGGPQVRGSMVCLRFYRCRYCVECERGYQHNLAAIQFCGRRISSPWSRQSRPCATPRRLVCPTRAPSMCNPPCIRLPLQPTDRYRSIGCIGSQNIEKHSGETGGFTPA